VSFLVTFNSNESFAASFAPQAPMDATFGEHIEVPVTDYYDGDYSITPSTQEQVIPIIGKTARQNITVGAIPSCFGLITWNGASVLTVS